MRYDTRCYFNVRSKADISRLNLPHVAENLKKLEKTFFLNFKSRICSEVGLSVNSPGIRGVSPEEEKEGYAFEKVLQKRKVLSLE